MAEEQFQIGGLVFAVNANHVVDGNNEKIAINDKTYAALMLFLKSELQTIKKDDLVMAVWNNLVVSDASIFKQVQVVRSVFSQLGLDKGFIENVYGQGYRITQQVSQEIAPENPKESKRFIWPVALLLLVLLLFFSVEQTKPFTDSLNDARKQSIIELSKKDWQKGLDHINELTLSDIPYSDSDWGFLKHHQGQALLELQQFDHAESVLNQSLQFYKQAKNDKGLGDIHLMMGRLYDFRKDQDKQTHHIEQSVFYYQRAGAVIQEVDGLLELAYIQKKQGDYESSIAAYHQVMALTEANGDKVGQVMAVNNLAATYLVMNQTNEALKLAEQGLALSMSTGNGQHIANSYSFLSQLYWRESQSEKALDMIGQALTYQLETKSHRHLSPKLMNVGYLLLETGQFEVADVILSVTASYAQALNVTGGSAVLALYQGMNAAHQMNWQAANDLLEKAYEVALKKNFNYKKPTTMAYFALSQLRLNRYLKALELANKVLADVDAGDREKSLALLVVAEIQLYSEQQNSSQQSLEKAAELIKENWLFGQIMWHQTALKLTANDQIEKRQQLQKNINELKVSWQLMAKNSQLDELLIKNLVTQVEALVVQHSGVSQSVKD